MAQQPHDMSYLDYNSGTNRSPSTSRQQYGGGAPGFNAGLSLPRQAQRPFEAPLGSSALYSDRHNPGYNARGMDTISGGAVPSYMLDGNQGWTYSASGAATVNGAVNGPNRSRSVNRRGALPQVRTKFACFLKNRC